MGSRLRKRRSTRGAHAPEINVTPLIDIVMVLIIFYLMVGSLISSDYADVPLPYSVRGEPAAAADVYVINVSARDSTGGAGAEGGVVRTAIVVQGAETDVGALARDVGARLARDPGMVIQLRASRDLPYRAVEPVVKACARAGATSLRLVTERAP